MSEYKIKLKFRQVRFILLGVLFGVIYWLIETSVHVYLLNEGSFFEQIFFPDFHEFWMRSLMGIIIMIFSISIQFMANKGEKANRALEESEEKFRELVLNIPQKIFTKDINLTYISCNGNFARDLGITPDEFKGKNDYDFFPKELADKYRDDDRRIMKKGETENIEERYIQDGEDVWVNTIKTPLRDEMGNITGILGIFWDITERKRAEEALQESEEKWRSLVENAPNIIMTLDRSGKILFINHTVPGLSIDDVVGSNAREYIQPEHNETLTKALEEAFQTGKSTTYEVSGTGPQGSVAYYSTRIGPIKENGEVVAAIQIITDITERKNMENKLKEHVSELERFNKFTVGRELKMVELKQEINKLLLSTGQPEKYKIPSLTCEKSSVEG